MATASPCASAAPLLHWAEPSTLLSSHSETTYFHLMIAFLFSINSYPELYIFLFLRNPCAERDFYFPWRFSRTASDPIQVCIILKYTILHFQWCVVWPDNKNRFHPKVLQAFPSQELLKKEHTDSFSFLFIFDFGFKDNLSYIFSNNNNNDALDWPVMAWDLHHSGYTFQLPIPRQAPDVERAWSEFCSQLFRLSSCRTSSVSSREFTTSESSFFWKQVDTSRLAPVLASLPPQYCVPEIRFKCKTRV